MLYFARSSPKLCRLSRSPRALALTVNPGTDLCCARAMKLASALESGLNRSERRKFAAAAATQTASTAAKNLLEPVTLHFSLCRKPLIGDQTDSAPALSKK